MAEVETVSASPREAAGKGPHARLAAMGRYPP